MNILQSLKEETRPLHDKLEGELDLLRSSFTMEDYLETLKLFYGFYVPLEPVLLLSENRRKLPLLESDLRDLGVSDLSVIPQCFSIRDCNTRSSRYGIMYVLEGSTLGGQVLSKHFKDKLNLERGLSFFSGYGKDTFIQWKSFQEELLTFSQSKEFDSHLVLESAKSTFKLLNDWLIQAN